MTEIVLFTDILRTLAIAGAAILVAVALRGAWTSYIYRSSGPPWVYRWLFLLSYILLILEAGYVKTQNLGDPPSLTTLTTIAAVIFGVSAIALINRYAQREWSKDGKVERRSGRDRRRRKS